MRVGGIEVRQFTIDLKVKEISMRNKVISVATVLAVFYGLYIWSALMDSILTSVKLDMEETDQCNNLGG